MYTLLHLDTHILTSNVNKIVELESNYLRGTDNLLDIFLLLLTVVLSELNEMQRSKTWVAEKMDTEKI